MANDEPLSASTLPLHADAAAFLRGPSSSSPPRPLLLAVSTYELVAERNERRGGIHLFDASGGELTPLGGVGSGSSGGGGNDGGRERAPPFPGVFDVKWMPDRGRDSRLALGMALADGSVRLMEVVEGGEGGEGGRGDAPLLLRETAGRFPLEVEVGGGDGEGEKDEAAQEQEAEEAAALPSRPPHPLDDPGAMALYLDVDKNNPSRIAVSFSDGRVAVLEVTATATTAAAAAAPSAAAGSDPARLETRALWRAHDAECWCVSFSPWDENVVYTGADDCEFLAWDLTEIGGGGAAAAAGGGGLGAVRRPKPAWHAGGGGKHSAGVCCISPSPNAGDSLMATGSYDGRVRVWDSRNPREPLFLCASAEEVRGEGGGEGGRETASSSSSSSAPLGGGAWRLVWHPGGEPRLLCAAMHAGFAVLRLEREKKAGEGEKKEGKEEARIEVEQRYRGHGADPSSLNGGAATLGYGCDWAFDERSGRLFAATASFYDNAVHLWEPR